MKRFVLLLFIVLALAGDKLPNDIRWVRDSQEYHNLCRQVYENAWEKVKERAAEQTGQWAVVMDLDETVLDNSLYQVEMVRRGESFSMETWAQWVNRAEAGAVPGAKAFIDSVRTLKNARIIYLSNRMAERTEATIQNLKSLGLYSSLDIMMLRKDKADKKTVRREEILTGTGRLEKYGPLVVIGWFGDAMGDFPTEHPKYRFGKEMFIFPNPMYGKW